MSKALKEDPRLYWRVHTWLRKYHEKALFCENRSYEKKTDKYEWALIKGKHYAKDRNLFIKLCTFCHRKYDWRPDVNVNHSRSHGGCAVRQEDFSGNTIKVWASASDAARHGYNQGLISAVVRGKRNHHKGYKWSFVESTRTVEPKKIKCPYCGDYFIHVGFPSHRARCQEKYQEANRG